MIPLRIEVGRSDDLSVVSMDNFAGVYGEYADFEEDTQGHTRIESWLWKDRQN